jgi:DNA-binding transcriptional ArsR family regulator
MAKQITQKQFFTALISLVESNPDFTVKADGMTATADDVVKFLNSRIESLEKKATKTSDKTNTEQAEVDEKVLSVMTKDNRKVGEIAKLVNAEYGTDYSSSKITASLGRLKGNGLVVNEVDKKNSYYRLAD